MDDPLEATFMIPVSNEPLRFVAVCGALSLLVHVTLDPAETVAGLGL